MFFLAKNIRKIGTWLHMRSRRTVANLIESFFSCSTRPLDLGLDVAWIKFFVGSLVS